jgi:hypothetical protein
VGFVGSVEDWAISGELVMDGEEGAVDESSGGFGVVLTMGGFMGCKIES